MGSGEELWAGVGGRRVARGRSRQQRAPNTSPWTTNNFLGSGFRTMVSVVASFQNPKTENEGR